jgi:hypothetical protein
MREHALADAAWLEERLEASGASASRRSAAALAQAMAHRALGETAEATASARRAIELDGSSPAAAIARSMLE